jgi:hypothetical protein
LVSSPSTPRAYLFSNKEDRHKYDEKLEEEKKIEPVNNVLKLMSKLDSYLK